MSNTPFKPATSSFQRSANDPGAQGGPQLAMPSNPAVQRTTFLICQKSFHIQHKLASIRSAVEAIFWGSEENTTSVTATCFLYLDSTVRVYFNGQDREWRVRLKCSCFQRGVSLLLIAPAASFAFWQIVRASAFFGAILSMRSQ